MGMVRNCLLAFHFLILFLCFQPQVFAQFTPSIYINSQLAVDDLSKTYKTGYGGGITGYYTINEEVDLLLSAGYIKIPGKEISDSYLAYQLRAITAFPINLGVNYNISRHFFLRGQGGILVFNEPEKVLGLSASGGLGLRVDRFEFTTSLTHWNKDGSTNFVNLQLAYKFWR